MITLQSGETDKIIVTGTTSTPPTPPTPPTPVDPDPVLDPEEIVGKIYVAWYDLNPIAIEDREILIKRNMLGTSIEVSVEYAEVAYAAIYSFNVTPTTVQVTQTDYNVLSIQIPTEVLEENIELNITLDYVYYTLKV